MALPQVLQELIIRPLSKSEVLSLLAPWVGEVAWRVRRLDLAHRAGVWVQPYTLDLAMESSRQGHVIWLVGLTMGAEIWQQGSGNECCQCSPVTKFCDLLTGCRGSVG